MLNPEMVVQRIALGRKGLHKPQVNMTENVPYPKPDDNNRLRSLAVGERPQERLQRLGSAHLSDTELLAMLLRSGTAGNDVLTLATRLLNEAGSLAKLTFWKDKDFRKLKGIGPVKALQLVTVMEVAKRVAQQGLGENPLMNNPEAIAKHMQPFTMGLAVEKFWVLCLDRKNRLQRCVEATSGIVSSSLVHPREVFRIAIQEAAAAIACAHNHPSGDPAPSSADLRATRQLREAAETVQIPLIDHVVIGRSECDPRGVGYYSFREAGVL